MNRRTLLGRMAIGAAAVLGLGAARAAEASESRAAQVDITPCPQCFTTIRPPQDDLGGVCVICWRRNTAEASEQDRIGALVDDVLAYPGKHPEIEARARDLMGSPRTGDSATDKLTVTGSSSFTRTGVTGAGPYNVAGLSFTPEALPSFRHGVLLNVSSDGIETDLRSDSGHQSSTFEAMQAHSSSPKGFQWVCPECKPDPVLVQDVARWLHEEV